MAFSKCTLKEVKEERQKTLHTMDMKSLARGPRKNNEKMEKEESDRGNKEDHFFLQLFIYQPRVLEAFVFVRPPLRRLNNVYSSGFYFLRSSFVQEYL